MNRIRNLFENKNRICSIYYTAGYPQIESTIQIMTALQDNGADMIELGIPYSDPLADGPVIQASSATALKNGMTIIKLFDQLENFRKDIKIPVILMGYMNPVLQYGFEKFCRDAASAGIDGLILPDLPDYEFEKIYGQVIHQYGLGFSFLVTPETSEKRIRKLDKLSSGFLYAVSSSSTTGKDQDFEKVNQFLQKLKLMNLNNPILVGFGIKDRKSFDTVCTFANGAIIGSAFIETIDSSDIPGSAGKFLKEIL